MRTLTIDERTFKRFTSAMEELMHYKKKDIDHNDFLNELIDVYEESLWGNIGGTLGGG
jgi:rRNA pseudouridine-1189 N-methylase Emg1 (Nep1/Mra1 family)